MQIKSYITNNSKIFRYKLKRKVVFQTFVKISKKKKKLIYKNVQDKCKVSVKITNNHQRKMKCFFYKKIVQMFDTNVNKRFCKNYKQSSMKDEFFFLQTIFKELSNFFVNDRSKKILLLRRRRFRENSFGPFNFIENWNMLKII